ncbi:xanthine dehydrogenase family protein molybdopterin-binding subunit [Hydrogenophaga sp. BPS33]|uniref:xanthine dehydrogenase family protein molybdopterin-binding subunit n=1 Tax=Hydrogenophaga sp. BPS33 TaxID=2651974 RepID=UPI0013200B67|nr:xanthine dehydrogenase family protein molybdopterin-binding subunit [Hydrogenophaga sp. BPS33]QHE87395.1 xanthine dehydrogenase family protein molybdopterin-binding subunit [Hydrogenophaga sp. BPS33]
MNALLPLSSADAALARVEDTRLLTGRGCYVHDVSLPGMLHAAFVRSVYPRTRIVSMDADAAREVEGFVAIVTGHDLGGLTLPPPNGLLQDLRAEPTLLLPTQAIRSVGQPLALVLASSAEAARQAAEAVWFDCEAQAPCNDLADGAPVVASVRHHTGDAPAGGAAVVRAVQQQPRVAAMALEPRAAVVRWDGAAGELTAWLPTQTPSRARTDVARLLGLDVGKVRVIAPDVGGAFGAKSSLGPEELVLAWAAREHRCAIKWTATRSEEFTSGVHGRGARLEGELALDAQGHFLHLSAHLRFPVGAWLPFSVLAPARNTARILPGPYRVAGVDIRARVEASDAAAVTIYRGAGRPEATLLMERLVERAARRLGVDPLDLRRRNLIEAHQMPWATPTGETLDAGDYRAVLERAAQAFGYEAERAEQARRRAAGEWVGVGTALYIEPCGQGWESARVTLQTDGTVEVASGSCAQGQGHETSYATIAAQVLGCDPAHVRVRHGDTAHSPEGIGALASRSMAIGGSAVLLAAQDAARRRAAGEALPITADQVYTAPAEAWSYGCVMARMAIDAETGKPRVERIVWADDAGRIVSPQLAEGQLLGGLAQGLGQALLERLVYDAEGQLVTGSLMDYAVPRADDMPPVELHSQHVPTSANALGAKGVGEAGCIGVPAALLNAAADALSPRGEPELDFPLTAERLWRALSTNHSPSQP